MYEKWIDILSRCQLFNGITKDQLNTMLICLKPRILEYKKYENITLEGQPFNGVGIILSGEAAIIKENAAGDRTILAKVKASDIFGESIAFSKSKVWPASVAAHDNCSVMFLPPDMILNQCQKLCESHKTLVNNMLAILSNKALMLNKKVEYLTTKSLRAKICAFLLDLYKSSGNTIFMMPMNRNELADFLNVSRPSLSREMCRMRDEGLIDFHRSSIRIENIDALKRSTV